ncbi:DrmB family protein [uncultured Sphingomonas sp.]|uniref:DrmB family protein n=1 Tax=uncultured Sphingomonas sp. TaxID=158754 RepID=UPI0035CB5E19
MNSSRRVTLRQSQLVTSFGPGAMVDLPTRSVIMGGLDLWHMRERGSWQPVHEPRAVAVLEALLRANRRLDDGVALTLRTPPVDDEGRRGTGEPPGVEARIFPTWFVAREAVEADGLRRRRLARWRDLDPRGRVDLVDDDGRRLGVTPIRFVAGCRKGHLQDVDWSYAVHAGSKERCAQPLWLEERGTSGDPQSTRVVCGCGAALSLRDAQADGRFGKCRGRRPWLHTDEPGGCDENLRFLTRTATNAYFPQVLTVISLPAAEDLLTRLVEGHMDALGWTETAADVAAARKSNPALRAALEGWGDEDVLARVRQLRLVGHQNLEKAPKVAEYDLLASGLAEIGSDAPDAKLHAQTLVRGDWGGDRPRLAPIASVVAVHRLREVSCLYGFTRFEAAPTAIDGNLEELYLAVEGAALAADLEWLPAVEQRGEGVFLRFDVDALRAWVARPAVAARLDALERGWGRWRDSQPYGDKLRWPGPGYHAMHGFSHALMNEIALDCGYPATALKERLYAISDADGDRFGLLVYTATTGAQGTLGGLIATLPRLGAIVERALDRLALCSGDPICAEHDPDAHADERALSGAACHSCLLVAETSCEARNLYLDRALAAATVSTPGAALFAG